jgi:hypothetical protein
MKKAVTTISLTALGILIALGIATSTYTDADRIRGSAIPTNSKGNLFNNSQLIEWSSKLNIPNYELMFKYVIDQNIGILQRTSNLEHLTLNWNLYSKPLLYNNSFIELNKNFLNKFSDDSNYVKIYG